MAMRNREVEDQTGYDREREAESKGYDPIVPHHRGDYGGEASGGVSNYGDDYSPELVDMETNEVIPQASHKRALSADHDRRKKGLSESDGNETTPVALLDQMTSLPPTLASMAVEPPKPKPQDVRATRSREHVKKVQEMFSEESIKVLITSYGELNPLQYTG